MDNINRKTDDSKNSSKMSAPSSMVGGTGDILGFYTPTSASGSLPIVIVDFPKPNGSSTGVTLSTLSSFNYTPTTVMLPTNTSSYNSTTKELVCLVSREQQLFMYDDGLCASGTMSVAPHFTTAPVHLGNELYGIDITSISPGGVVDISIAARFDIGVPVGIGAHTFTLTSPYVFNHEQMSSATNGTDELYFISGIDLIKVFDPGNTFNSVITDISLDQSNQYIFYGLEYCRPNVLIAMRKNNYLNPVASLELVEIDISSFSSPIITVLYDLQSKLSPTPAGWIINTEFYSSTYDTCNHHYYVSSKYDIHDQSRLVEINIKTKTHVEQIFPLYLFGIEMKDVHCDGCKCGNYYDVSYRPSELAFNIAASCGDTLIAQCDGMIPWTMNGIFECIGSDCPDSTEMTWTLTNPDGTITSNPVTADPVFNISIPASEFNSTGLYQLVLSSICGMDTCYCEFLIEVQCDADTCCTDFDTFLTAAQSVDVMGELGDCKLHYNAIGLDSCMQISYVWGDNPAVIEGPYDNNTAVWHTYSSPGIYNVCYFIEQVTPPDSICWVYEHCEDIEIICDTCQCGDFSDMYILSLGAPSQVVSCGGDTVTLGCPTQGIGFEFSGAFECDGALCPHENTVSWTLTGPGNPQSGTVSFYTYYAIKLLPTYFSQPGLYTLTLNGQCGNSECPCIINFYVDCPDLCPCEPDDIQALDIAVSQGFAQTLYTNSCQACFSPIALSDCETVEWHLGSTNNSPIATSVGNQTICYNFNNPGTYTVIMVVTRLKPDGTICEVFTNSRTVTITCISSAICTKSVFTNPGFADSAIEGGLNSGGASAGWMGIWGDPKVENGVAGSLNDWTIKLQSNNQIDSVDVLSTMNPVCLNKGTGVISMRMKRGIKEKGIKSAIIISLLQGDEYTPSIDWNTTDCHRLIELDISPIDTGEWVDIEIPYDITSWLADDDCDDTDGVLVRALIQLDWESRMIAMLDSYCSDDLLVVTEDLTQNENIEIFPNPTDGNFTLHFDYQIPAKSHVQFIDIEGRIWQKILLNSGHREHSLSISDLPPGIYFIKVTEDGMPVWIDKILKQ